MSLKLVIFDLDGTLFRTETVDVEAINKALTINGYSRRGEKEILSLIGGTLDDVSISLLNTKDMKIIEKFKSDVIRFEKDEISRLGKLYHGVIESLISLKDSNYKLCICSNGGQEYLFEISKKFKLNRIFEDIYPNNSKLTKSQRVGVLKEKYGSDNFIMVGDRTSDIEAAKDNKGVSIGVSYGFGGNEVLKADYIANNFKEVEMIIRNFFEEEEAV